MLYSITTKSIKGLFIALCGLALFTACNKTVAVSGINAGSAIITVKSEDGAKTATCAVKVIVPENATNKNVSWLSGDPTVADVDNTGKVTAYKEDIAAIWVILESTSFTTNFVVTVSALPKYSGF